MSSPNLLLYAISTPHPAFTTAAFSPSSIPYARVEEMRGGGVRGDLREEEVMRVVKKEEAERRREVEGEAMRVVVARLS